MYSRHVRQPIKENPQFDISCNNIDNENRDFKIMLN